MLVVYGLSRGSTEENLRQIFRLTDVNDDGIVTKEELRNIVNDILLLSDERRMSQAKAKDHIVDKAFDDMDMSKDGSITIEDFVATCLQHNFIIIKYIQQFHVLYV